MLPGVLERLRKALHQRPHIICPMGTPGSSRLLLVLAMRVLPDICRSLVLTHLTRLPVQEKELARLPWPLELVALLFGPGTGYWSSVTCFQSPRMGLLV